MKRKFRLLVVSLFFHSPVFTVAQQASAVLCKGRWVVDQQGEAVRPPVPGGRMMGLQTSGLSFDGKALWSVGDQRSNYPANVFQIDPKTAHLVAEPIRVEVTRETRGEVPGRLSADNADLEGVCIKPDDRTRLYITIESDGLLILECAYEPSLNTVLALRVLSACFVVDPIEADRNRRFEGIAVEGQTLYVAYEKDAGGHPRIYSASLPIGTRELRLKGLAIPFSKIPPRPAKGDVNVNGLDVIRGEALILVMVARDQERLLFYELESAQLSYVDLDFRDPEGHEIYWTSPEGVAVDPEADRVWLINDPDSLRGNYRRRGESVASGNYKAMVPLLFELSLGEILAARVPVH